ncbi:NfeD family protein [Maridesulfovibrio sp.]|uniref:NfeD family protein n=1 Tax=Maridesulfovibrio sp. TaxID=2795000 RepID=UPI002A189E3D|nr:NfeD family protein [Maridesulfovibrio sp.]
MNGFGTHKKVVIVFLMLFMSILPASVFAEQINVLYAQMEGGISPAQVRMLEGLVRQAENDDSRIILLRLDTPGGLGDSMREMVRIIMSAEKPVCIWVGPSGAKAASAGTFLVAAAQVAAMAPGTTLGAASPVSVSGDDLPETMARKVTNDMAWFIRGIAQERGRNADWYAATVEQGDSVEAKQAVTINAVDFLAVSVDDFLEQLGARGIDTPEGRLRFSPQDIRIFSFDAGFSYSVLSWLLDPQVAYLLLVAGFFCLLIEFIHPGAVVPGVVGGFCLLTGLYALSILPTNAAGILLIFFGAVLFVLEVFITSYGLLSFSAAAAMLVGSMILFKDGEISQVPLATVLGAVLSFSACAVALVFLVVRAQLRNHQTGRKTMVGLTGEVFECDGHRLKIRVRGEIWSAECFEACGLEIGTEVIITDINGLTLSVVRK